MTSVPTSASAISILVNVPDQPETEIKGWWSSEGSVELRRVPVEALRKNLNTMSNSLLLVLQDIKAVGQFKLKEVTVQVEVSADGGVNFVGTAKLGGKGAITLKFEGP